MWVYCWHVMVQSTGCVNVCCTYCNWREQPPLLIPATQCQQERHSSAGKSTSCFLFSLDALFRPISINFGLLFSPLSIFHLLSHFFLLSALHPLKLASSTSLLSILPSHHTNMAVFGLVRRGWSLFGGGWVGERA